MKTMVSDWIEVEQIEINMHNPNRLPKLRNPGAADNCGQESPGKCTSYLKDSVYFYLVFCVSPVKTHQLFQAAS